MHVIQVVSPAPVGGLETVVANLTIGLAEAGAQLTVVATLGAGEPLPSVFEALHSARIVPVRADALRLDREFNEVTRLLPSADVIHTHGYRPDIVQGALRRGVATVSTVHGFTGGDWLLRTYERLQLRALRDFSAVVAVSRPLATSLEAEGVPPRRIETIPNAIREPAFLDRKAARSELGVPSSTFVVGWVGRMTFEKNPQLAIEAFGRALPRMECAELLMIGDGPLRAALEAPSPPGVRFLGAVPGAGRYMKALDALILSSDTEGTPVVLIEAMWAGTPIVTTDVGGIPLLLSRDEAAIVEAGSAPRLASSLAGVFLDAAAARNRADRARARVQSESDFKTWIARYADVYRRVSPGS